uniref:hypothetical protein n=1 Tax=Flavobacterium sp. TaxID=239 RepID=UPI004047397F
MFAISDVLVLSFGSSMYSMFGYVNTFKLLNDLVVSVLSISLNSLPFSVYKISHVNIFTNNTSRKESNQFNDSITYNNFTIYSAGKLKYKPKAITNA